MSASLTDVEGAVLLALARAAIEDRLLGNGALVEARSSVHVTPQLERPRAAFVTLELRDEEGARRLRGCIGSLDAPGPAHASVVDAAIEAAFADPRFSPLTAAEYPNLVISVSVLTPLEAQPSSEAIVLGRDGVVLECDGRRALFLPEVAVSQGWSRVQLLEQLARKARLPADAWRRAALSTFRTDHFGEAGPRAARIRRS